MSMPAGWYDDGSGRQRWWDGARWTDDYAPVHDAGSPQPGASAQAQAPSAPPAAARRSPILGFVGLGLAVLGTILACIPVVFGIGVVLLLAGFVVSLIGLFTKGAAKWPSIVGMILSVVGGVIGVVVLVVTLLANAPAPIDTAPATSVPSPSAEPSEPSTDASDSRPSPEEIAEEFAATIRAGGVTTYDDMPEFYPCVGQFLYDSDLSDEALRLIIVGDDPPESERAAAEKAITDAVLTCDPQP
ncbi:MAG: DUF2510 domain-containing protein [Microbacterium sp.]